jgi:hypothetical protein
MKMSNGEKMIFAATYSNVLKSSKNCTVEDCINNASAAVKLFRGADVPNKLTEEAKDMWLAMTIDVVSKEEDLLIKGVP